MDDKYRVVVVATEDGYLARAVELPGCEVSAESRGEALEQLEQEIAAQTQTIVEQGGQLPSALVELPLDGKLTLEVTPTLHAELLALAMEEGVELQQLLVEILARAAARRGPRRQQRRGSRRGRGGPEGQRYHNIMENRADFIEYVRQLERDGPDRGRGGRGRGRR